jgi:hypothetical protein
MPTSRSAILGLCAVAGAASAESPAIVRDLERASPLDRMEVMLLRVDGAAVERAGADHEVPAGTHRMELQCITHHPGGMADFTVLSTREFAATLAAGRVYPLAGRLDTDGRCTPALDGDAAVER